VSPAIASGPVTVEAPGPGSAQSSSAGSCALVPTAATVAALMAGASAVLAMVTLFAL
jgi:hypothetical protein